MDAVVLVVLFTDDQVLGGVVGDVGYRFVELSGLGGLSHLDALDFGFVGAERN